MAKEGKHAADDLILLALVCGATVEGAARQAGVSASTVRRRVRNPGFRRRLNRRRSELHVRLADQFLALCSEAVRTTAQLMQSSYSGSTRLGAARAVVEFALKTRESADLTTRVAELEQRLAEQSGSRNGNYRGGR
jgi:transposase-like protein